MNDLMRPALYGSYPPDPAGRASPDRTAITTDVVGPICETGDFFARDRALPDARRAASSLCIGAAGAYGSAMASNYNTRPRAAEVLVNGGELHRDPHARDLRAARRERAARLAPSSRHGHTTASLFGTGTALVTVENHARSAAGSAGTRSGHASR